jgi:hypothetical protein
MNLNKIAQKDKRKLLDFKQLPHYFSNSYLHEEQMNMLVEHHSFQVP